MSNYVTLLGAEEVSHAASKMQDAANSFGSAVGNHTYALEKHQRFMDGWLARLEALLEREAGSEPGE